MSFILKRMRPFNTTLSFAFTLAVASAQAQEAPVTPAEEPAAAAKPDEKAAQQPRIDVTGQRSAVDERRNSTAAKIVITREDIEQYGDTNLGDVMRRLPGVTTGGRPGRGGPPAMRGMGGGYTQILVNGERNPPGFSIENISPDQVERIEILRAPTAETGTRAVAGTINIILREPLRTQSDEIKTGVQEERNRYSPNFSWNRNSSFSESGTYNLSLSLNRNDQLTDTRTSILNTDLTTGQPTLQQEGTSSAESIRNSAVLSSRFQWKLGQGEQFSLQPFLLHSESHSLTLGTLTQSLGTTPAPYATSGSTNLTNYDVMRLNAQLMKRLDAQTRGELRVGVGQFSLNGNSALAQFDANAAPTYNETTTQRISDKSWSLTGKLSRNLESGHSLVGGAELEGVKRTDTSTLVNGSPQLADFGGDITAATRRTAVYLQDEWDPAANWSANLGLRWEAIETRSDSLGTAVRNESRVLSPIGHLVWRFASPGRDQLRLSLTQSYKPPTTQNLISRPSINTRFPAPLGNDATYPDRAGNPTLKPELAQGLDLAYEHFIAAGGIVSVNFFQRNITDLIRNVTRLENVSWANVPRYVSRPQNVGDAVTRGIEFDAKFKLSELVAGAPAVNMHANVSVYRSAVKDIQGPYNRIDQQPSAIGNLGADYKFPKSPWAVGGNFALTPSYTIQGDNTQAQVVGKKRVMDVYALFSLSPTTRLRFGASNVAALDSLSSNSITTPTQLQTSSSVGRTDVVASVRFETRI